MYHVNTEFVYGGREDELSALEATFFIDVAKPSAIDTIRYYHLLYVKFFSSDVLFYLFMRKNFSS